MGAKEVRTMRGVGMWIDHQQVAARKGESMRVENPATEETIARVPRESPTTPSTPAGKFISHRPHW
jgi:hypothetical protein